MLISRVKFYQKWININFKQKSDSQKIILKNNIIFLFYFFRKIFWFPKIGIQTNSW